MKPSLKSPFIGLAIIGATLTGNAATLLNFDDLSTGPAGSAYALIQNGYGGLQWTGFGVLNPTLLQQPDGYLVGMISANNVAFNIDQYNQRLAYISNASGFDLDSAYLTAQVASIQVEVQGFTGNQLTYDNTYTLSPTTPTLINFNYDGINQAKFIPLDSTSIFAMDNLTVTVPEPNTAVLISLGVALSSLGTRKKKRLKAARGG